MSRVPQMAAGFVLTGGRSARMGRDKALLPWRGATLAEHAAAALQAVAGCAMLIGAPERYRHLPLQVLPDRYPQEGPLAGILTALEAPPEGWRLITACDMPLLTVEFLEELAGRAAACEADCLLPQGPSGRVEPLCAAYHSRCAPALRQAWRNGLRKVRDALAGVRVALWPVEDSLPFANVNTPDDWGSLEAALRLTHGGRPSL